MNKQRKSELQDVSAMIGDAMDRLTEIRDEEQEAFDNMPEGLQCSSRGDSMQEAIDMMDEWYEELEDIQGKIDEYTG